MALPDNMTTCLVSGGPLDGGRPCRPAPSNSLASGQIKQVEDAASDTRSEALPCFGVVKEPA